MGDKRVPILFSIILIVIVVLFVVVGLGLLFFCIISQSKNDSHVNTLSTYQYTEITPFSNETDHGFVTMNRDLPEREFLSYRNKANGRYVIISKFGGEEYECTGSCYCDPGSRRISTVLSRGLGLVVSAFSATMAINIAKETFSSDCSLRFADACPQEEIVSRVSKCNRLDRLLNEAREEREKVGDFSNWFSFFCHGFCLDNTKIKQLFKLVNSDKPTCEKLQVTGPVDVECKKQGVGCMVKAYREFRQRYLQDFCSMNSEVDFTAKEKTNFCYAGKKSSNIKCVQKNYVPPPESPV